MTPVQFAAVYGFGVWNIFIATTLYQEIHIPFVSSQKLVLPCETPMPGSWLEYLGESLSMLPWTRTAIRSVSAGPQTIHFSKDFLVELSDTSTPAHSFWNFFERNITKPDGWDFPNGHQWSYLTANIMKTEL